MQVQFDVILDLDDADASDIGEGRKAAEPGENLPADSGGAGIIGSLWSSKRGKNQTKVCLSAAESVALPFFRPFKA